MLQWVELYFPFVCPNGSALDVKVVLCYLHTGCKPLTPKLGMYKCMCIDLACSVGYALIWELLAHSKCVSLK